MPYRIAGMMSMARARGGTGIWRWLAAASCAAFAITLSSCGSSPVVTATTDTPTQATTEATTEAPASTPPTQEAAGFADSGDIKTDWPDGYTATINYTLSASNFQKSIVNDAPGYASVTFSADPVATVANTTSGRANHHEYTWQPYALYPIRSFVCTATRAAVDRVAGGQQMPGFGPDAVSVSYCSLRLSGMLTRGAGEPLGPSEVAAIGPQPGGLAAVVISGVAEGSVSQLITELQAPAKIVYQMNYAAFSGWEQLKVEGEYCAGYEHGFSGKYGGTLTKDGGAFVPSKEANDVVNVVGGFFVPTKYGPFCK